MSEMEGERNTKLPGASRSLNRPGYLFGFRVLRGSPKRAGCGRDGVAETSAMRREDWDALFHKQSQREALKDMCGVAAMSRINFWYDSPQLSSILARRTQASGVSSRRVSRRRGA
jgi:hypothetical protein